MTVFSGSEAIEGFLEELDGWLTRSVEVYLIGGSAMTVRGLKDQTEDIDLAFSIADEFEHVVAAVQREGFEVTSQPTESFEGVGTTIELYHPDRAFRIDLFERQIVGKVWITDRMRDRADPFWTGVYVTASVLSDEDMFLLKAVSGGDLAAARTRDVDDMRYYAQRGLNYEQILTEIEAQRPFNEGSTEAKQIRDGSHPLFNVDNSVTRLSGLPDAFTNRISKLGTEFEIERVVLSQVEEGTTSIDAIRPHVLANVRSLANSDTDRVNAGIDRLVEKGVLAVGDNRYLVVVS